MVGRSASQSKWSKAELHQKEDEPESKKDKQAIRSLWAMSDPRLAEIAERWALSPMLGNPSSTYTVTDLPLKRQTSFRFWENICLFFFNHVITNFKVYDLAEIVWTKQLP
jgi:hypothetical protein